MIIQLKPEQKLGLNILLKQLIHGQLIKYRMGVRKKGCKFDGEMAPCIY